jgi:hypothetical protein
MQNYFLKTILVFSRGNFVYTECARDRGPCEEKNARRQSEVWVPGNMIAHRETQIHASKWARSLNFWRLFKKVVRKKQKKRVENLLFNFFVCERHNPRHTR